MTVECPICHRGSKAKETPLPTYYRLMKSKMYNVTSFKEWVKGYTEYVEKKLKSRDMQIRWIHTSLWACNDCIAEKRAMQPNYDKQNYGMGGPIITYITYDLLCTTCQQPYQFTCQEQQFWYEELGFIIDSFPKNCLSCRTIRQQKRARNQRLAMLLKKNINELTVAELEELQAIYLELGNQQKANRYKNLLKKRAK